MTQDDRKEVFMELYSPVHERFQRFCRARTKSYDDAKDLASETILKTLEHLDNLRDRQAFLHFMFGIASRLLNRKYRRKKFWGIFDLFTAEKITDTEINPEENADVALLYDAIARLTPKLQEAIVLHCISGFSLAEVAEIQGASLSAVKVRVMRGKEKLGGLLTVKKKEYGEVDKEVKPNVAGYERS